MITPYGGFDKLFNQLSHEVQHMNELPRVNKHMYSLIAKGDEISYFLHDFDYHGDIHYVNVYRIIKLDHKSGNESKLFEYCAGKPLHTKAKCHCVYQTNIPKSPFQCFYSNPELFFQLAIQADTRDFIKFAGSNDGNFEYFTYKNKGLFYANFSFKIENPFTHNDKLIEIKSEGDAAEGSNSKCFEKLIVKE